MSPGNDSNCLLFMALTSVGGGRRDYDGDALLNWLWWMCHVHGTFGAL